MKYEYIDHTADLKVRAYGKTLEEAFANAAIGGFDFLTQTSKVRPAIEKSLSISSKRVESLLYDFLEELLFLLDTEGFLVNSFRGMKITEDREAKGETSFLLQCTALGDNYKNYKVKGDIKAVTYSEMMIRKEKPGFVVDVVLDI